MPDGSDPAPSPSATNEPLQASKVSGNFELAVFAPTSTFAADEDIDITVRLSYLGADAWTWIGYGAPGLLTYSIVGIRGDDPLLTMECHQRQLHRDIPEVAKLADLQGGPRPLRLSSGRYQINVIALLDQGGCARDPLRIQTTVEIAVTEGPNDIPLWTDPSRADHCELRANTGTLVRDPDGSLTVDLGSGIRRTIWPRGYAGTLVDGVAELFGADGSVVAREGDVIRFGGGFGDIGPIRPCGEIEVLDPDSTGWLPPR
jgi:hypothetical protein